MSIRFASSRHNDMRPLAFQGILATNCYDQLHALLESNADFLAKHGMPDAGLFLAEPMHDSRTGSIDWYTQAKGKPVPLTDLPQEEQTAIMEALSRSGAAMQALIDEKGKTQGGKDSMAMGLLRLALQHPSPDDIYVADGRPILTNWGFRQGEGEASPEDIMRLGARITKTQAPDPAVAPIAVPPFPPAARRGGCLGWLFPLLLLLLLLWLLLAALGLAPSPLPAGCFHEDDSATRSEELRQATLDDEYARILEDLAALAALCRPVREDKEPAEREAVIPDLAPKQPEPEPEELPEEKPAVVPFFGDIPNIPEKQKPAPAPKEKAQKQPKKQPKAETSKPKKNEAMKIPNDAAQKNDLSFLEGCWKSDTGLYNNHGEPIDAEYCFNKRGQGRRFVREPNGQRCSGNVTAKFQGRKLTMDGSSAHCPNGREYVPQKIDCTGSGTATNCKGHELGGRGNRWNHRFTRK